VFLMLRHSFEISRVLLIPQYISERSPFPSREKREQRPGVCTSDDRQAEKRGKGWWDSEQPDRDLACCLCACIACEALGPRESVVCSLCTRKRSSWRGLRRWRGVNYADVNALVTKELHQLPPMGATRPISPEHWMRSQGG
jgi:hypothetical protein